VPPSDDHAAADRARARAARILAAGAAEGIPSTPEERVALAVELTRAAWAFSAQPWPSYDRSHMPVRIIRR
jgi:hypothetical protein